MRIRVLHPRSEQLAFSCDGPAPSGACRHADDEGLLPCTGMLLQPEHATSHHGVFRFVTAKGAPGCPLRSLVPAPRSR